MRILSGLLFFPRGGSSHVARALGEELVAQGHELRLVSGSLPDGPGDAAAFYAGLDVWPVDFAAGDAPMHPSYEDRPGAPDPCFAMLDDADFEAQVEAWCRALDGAGAHEADVLHLHHLTPLHEAASRVAPGVPIVTHLHGTELSMLEQITAGPPAHWVHAEAWARRMRRWAGRSSRVLLLAEAQRARVAAQLGVEPARCVVVPNGFDPERFAPRELDRPAFWRRNLVAEPRGWRPGGQEGSVAYPESVVAPLVAGPVLICAGRFTSVKRIGLLVEAFADAQRRTATRPSLVLLGGHPGEWEGEHPLEAVARTGARDVVLAGWHGHDALPDFLNAADALVLASVREQFGLVLVEAMACGLPCVAVDAHGPAEVVQDGRTGWLIAPDDRVALADALVSVCDSHAERRRRGGLAREDALDRYAWPALAERVGEVLEAAADDAMVDNLNH